MEIKEETELTLADQIQEVLDGAKGDLTPYRVITLINQEWKLNLPTQMGYNYKTKYFGATKNEEGKWICDLDTVQEWMEGYLKKNLKK